MHTNCNQCVFSIVKNSQQVGCKLNRADILEIESIDDVNNSFILKRFCTTYRPSKWLEDLSVIESVSLEDTVLNEVSPRVGFFIIFNHDLESLKTTLLDIKHQSRMARYAIIINDRVEYNEEIYKILMEYFGEYNENEFIFHIVQIINEPQMMSMVIDESFRHAKNGWAYICHAGENIDRKLIDKIHKRVNIDLKRLSIIKPYDDNLNGLLFQTALFKFLNGNNVKTFTDTTVDNRPFLEKVEDAAKNSHKDTMITWSEFNES